MYQPYNIDAFEGYDMNGDNLISREELSIIFKAYFRLSMDLVRDVVRVVEEGIMEHFDEHGTKPVSAAFPAPRMTNMPDFESMKRPYSPERDQDPTSQLSAARETLEQLYRNPRRTSDGEITSPVNNDLLPMIETMSQEAIEDLVSHLFEYANPLDPSYLTWLDFEKTLKHDMNLLAWLEALGSVF